MVMFTWVDESDLLGLVDGVGFIFVLMWPLLLVVVLVGVGHATVFVFVALLEELLLLLLLVHHPALRVLSDLAS